MLGQKFTVYAVDRRGRGQRDDSAAYSIEREYEDIGAVVGFIQGPVNLLGHSYGALYSLEAALRVTNLNKLILYGPAID
jgi:pimeloyl-ACP methyl ester carboxylesterase